MQSQGSPCVCQVRPPNTRVSARGMYTATTGIEFSLLQGPVRSVFTVEIQFPLENVWHKLLLTSGYSYVALFWAEILNKDLENHVRQKAQLVGLKDDELPVVKLVPKQCSL